MNDYPTSTPASVNTYETGFATPPAVAPAQSFGAQAEDTPEAVRAYAEKTIAQFRDAYAHTRLSMEEATKALETALEQTGKGTSEFSTKVMEMAQKNANSGFDFARKLASARTQAEAVELQTAFMRQQFDTVKAQAEEIQQLTARIATDASQPIQQQFSRTVGRYASNV
jgi:phasin